MGEHCGVYPGTVVQSRPDGAVRARVPHVLGNAVTEWASPQVTIAAPPKTGATVYVSFLAGDLRQPVYTSPDAPVADRVPFTPLFRAFTTAGAPVPAVDPIKPGYESQSYYVDAGGVRFMTVSLLTADVTHSIDTLPGATVDKKHLLRVEVPLPYAGAGYAQLSGFMTGAINTQPWGVAQAMCRMYFPGGATVDPVNSNGVLTTFYKGLDGGNADVRYGTGAIQLYLSGFAPLKDWRP